MLKVVARGEKIDIGGNRGKLFPKPDASELALEVPTRNWKLVSVPGELGRIPIPARMWGGESRCEIGTSTPSIWLVSFRYVTSGIAPIYRT
jgi:hypothetical protein